MRYTDFLLLTTEPRMVKAEGKKRLIFNLQVPGIFNDPTACELDVKTIRVLSEKASSRDADWQDARLLGEALAAALLPQPVWNALDHRITQAAAGGEGVRVRLMLSGADLNNWPWEFMVFNRAGGESKVTDFLTLMPNVSLVRHRATPLPAWRVTAKIPARVAISVASPSGWPKLDVSGESSVVVNALAGCPQLTVESAEHVRRTQLPEKTRPVHLFHFAGHGKFDKELSSVPGAYEGKASIILEDEYGDEDPLDAEILALQLRDAGVRVAVLGACLTAQRDDVSAWSSAAEALLKAELGAVVGMQFPVLDKSALRFAERFYGALAIGLSIDEAVAAGRVAVAASGDSRGWATPALYLRSPDGVIFPEFKADPGLANEREQFGLNAQQKIAVLEGSAVVLKIHQMEVGADSGTVIHGIGEALGSVKVRQEIGRVTKTGSATVVEIGAVKQGRRKSKKKTARSRAHR